LALHVVGGATMDRSHASPAGAAPGLAVPDDETACLSEATPEPSLPYD
jgi:hypothetical protein